MGKMPLMGRRSPWDARDMRMALASMIIAMIIKTMSFPIVRRQGEDYFREEVEQVLHGSGVQGGAGFGAHEDLAGVFVGWRGGQRCAGR